MAFPSSTSTTLDAFSTAKSPLDGAWVGPAFADHDDQVKSLGSGTVRAVNGDITPTTSSSYYAATGTLATSEVYSVVTAANSAGFYQSLFIRCDGINSGYELQFSVADAWTAFYRIDNGVYSANLLSGGSAIGNGYGVGIQATGSTFKIYKAPYPYTTWTQVGSDVTDTTYPAGYLGLGGFGPYWRFNTFGGGGTQGVGFPTTPLLDTFNNYIEQPLAHGWDASNAALDGDSLMGCTWSVAYGPGSSVRSGLDENNCECYVTLLNAPKDSMAAKLFARLRSPGTFSATGYAVIATENTMTLRRVTGGVLGTTLAITHQTMAANDKIGLSCHGSQIRMWHKPFDGEWTLRYGVDDPTGGGGYASGGTIGCGTASNQLLDDFGGSGIPYPVGSATVKVKSGGSFADHPVRRKEAGAFGGLVKQVKVVGNVTLPPPPPSNTGVLVGAGANGHSASTISLCNTNFFSVMPFKHMRIEADLSESPQTILSYCNAVVAKGATPLLNITGDTTYCGETTAYNKIAALAPVVGSVVSAIEWGNEDYGGWNGWQNSGAAYDQGAAAYGRSALGACRAGYDNGVKVLVQAGGQYHQQVVTKVRASAPTISTYVGGWTLHLYWEGEGLGNMNEDYKVVISNTQSQINDTAHPDIWLTEWGFSSDNGRGPLQPDNYGHDRYLTYQGASDWMDIWWGAIKNKVYAAYIFQAVDNAASGSSLSREYYFGTAKWSGAFWNSSIADKGAYSDAVRRVIAEGAP